MLISKPRLPLPDILCVGLLPSPLKKLVYRFMGYKIGRGVSLGLGSVIRGRSVAIGDGVRLGFLTIVRGTTIRIDAHVQIGAMTFLDTPHLHLGEGTKINEQVFVGGLQFPDSSFVVGRNCQIMQMCFINPARSITLGDDSGIGGDSLLFGHSSWLSKFDGYPVEFDTIEIGRSVSLSWRTFVLAGARIGDGAVIGANSLVRGTIPGRCLAIGYPARVVSKEPEFPRPVGDAEKREILAGIVAEMIEYFRASGLSCQADERGWRIARPRRGRWRAPRWWRLTVSAEPWASATEAPDTDILVSLHALPPALRTQLEHRGATWVDIAGKERSDRASELGEEVILFLRRYGVRFLRWRPADGAPANGSVEAPPAGPGSPAAPEAGSPAAAP